MHVIHADFHLFNGDVIRLSDFGEQFTQTLRYGTL